MELPLNNRIRAEHIIPQEILENSNIQDGLVEHLNRQVMSRITDELLKHKPKIIEQSTIKHNHPYRQDYHRLQAEVFVFTKDELVDFIRKVQMETSIQIREQITLVNNQKNK